MDLDGVAPLVTGGAAGVGAGIAERLAGEGMHVVIADLDEEHGQETASGTGGSFVRADVATSAGVGAAMDTATRLGGPVGVLVNNAGGVEGPCFPAADPAKWQHTLDLNLRAVMCRGGEPDRLLPLIDWQTALPPARAGGASAGIR